MLLGLSSGGGQGWCVITARNQDTSAMKESTAANAQALETFKSKLMSTTDEGSTNFASSLQAARGVDYQHKANNGTQDRENTWDWHRA